MILPGSPFTGHPARAGVLLKALLGLGLLLLLVAIAWVALLPGIVASTIHAKTGFTVKIDALSVNPFTANAQVRGLVVQNPAGWPEANFIEVRQFTADVQLWPLLGGRFVANEIVADIAQVTLVTNPQGVLNTVAFSRGFSGGEARAAGPSGSPAATGGSHKGFMIHRLRLKFDQLVFADYSRSRPVVKTYDLHLDREMTEVDSAAKLLSPFTGAALGLAASALGGMNPKDADALTEAVEVLQSAGKKTGETLKNLFRSLENKKP